MSRVPTAALTGIAARASGQIFLVGVTLVATRFLGPSEFGVYAIAVAFITLSRTLLYTGPFEYQVKAPNLEEVASACLIVTLIVASLTTLIVAILGLSSHWLFDSPSVGMFALALAPSNMIAAIASWEESQIVRKGRLTAYYAITMSVEAVCAAMAATLLFMGYGLVALGLQIYARNLLLLIAFRFLLTLPPLHRPSGDQIWLIVRWSVSRYGSTLVNFMVNYSVDLMLGIVASTTATGLYRASNRIVTAVTDMFAQPISVIAMSQIGRRFSQGLPADGGFLRMTAGMVLVAWPGLVGLACFADELTPLMLGPQWGTAAPIVAVLCIGKMIGMLSITASAQLIAYDRQKTVLKVQSIAAVVTVLLVPLAMSGGLAVVAAAGAAVTATAAVTIVVLASRFSTIKRRDWAMLATTMIVPTFGTVAGSLLGRLAAPYLTSYEPGRLAIGVAAGIVGWAIAIAIIRKPAIKAVRSLESGNERAA